MFNEEVLNEAHEKIMAISEEVMIFLKNHDDTHNMYFSISVLDVISRLLIDYYYHFKDIENIDREYNEVIDSITLMLKKNIKVGFPQMVGLEKLKH